MHHIKKLKAADPRSNKAQMSAMGRTQIPVCKSCHRKIHKGVYDGKSIKKRK